eukprot:COSAG06_NODE_1828_length_8275_cov_2.284002_1_plen_188_part_10
MSSSSAANSLGLGIGLAVGAAASAAAAAVWYAVPAAGADASSEARTLARALRRRALELGVPAVDMAAAEDMGGTDGLAALVQAVQSARDPPRDGRGAAAATQRQGLRDELAGLKLAALRSRASEMGVTEEQVKATHDADDPRAALVEAILGAPPAPSASGSGGPGDEQMLTALLGGGARSVETISSVL